MSAMPPASIFRRRNGWQAVVYYLDPVDGRRRRWQQMCRTKAEARAVRAELVRRRALVAGEPVRDANRAAAAGYPITPVLKALAADVAEAGTTIGPRCILARRLGVDVNTVARWELLDPWMADRAAIAVGVHPALLWASWIDDGLAA